MYPGGFRGSLCALNERRQKGSGLYSKKVKSAAFRLFFK